MSPGGVRGEPYGSPHVLDNGGNESCAASTWTTTSDAGSMPRGVCSSPAATRRIRNQVGSAGPSTCPELQAALTPYPRQLDAAAALSGFRADRRSSEAVMTGNRSSSVCWVEIAELLGVSKQRADQITDEPGLPAPIIRDGRAARGSEKVRGAKARRAARPALRSG